MTQSEFIKMYCEKSNIFDSLLEFLNDLVDTLEKQEERVKKLEKICKNITRFCDCGYAIERGKINCTNNNCKNYE